MSHLHTRQHYSSPLLPLYHNDHDHDHQHKTQGASASSSLHADLLSPPSLPLHRSQSSIDSATLLTHRPTFTSSSSSSFFQPPLVKEHPSDNPYRTRIPSIVVPPPGPLPLRRASEQEREQGRSTGGSSPYEQPYLPPLSAGAAGPSSATGSRLHPHPGLPSLRSYTHSRLTPTDTLPYATHFHTHSHGGSSFPLSASSISSQALLDERGLRSPHPPLTASLQGLHNHLWPPPLPPIEPPIHHHSYTRSNSRSPLHDYELPPARSYYTTPLDLPRIPGPSHQYSTTASSSSSYPSAPPFLPPPINYARGSPVHIPPPLRFKYSATPPDMPPRKKPAGTTASSTPRTVSSTTNAGSGSRGGRKAGNGKGWTMEHTFDSVGQKKEVIVIDDSASPLVQPDVPRKRTRAQVAAEQAMYNGGSVLSNGHASASVTGSAKKRKVDPAETGSAKKNKAKLASTATSASVQTTGTSTWQQTQAAVPKATQWLKPATQSGPPVMPAWDDAEGHYIVKPDDVIGGRYKIVRLLGQGTFGKVVEARHIETRQKVAIKVIRAVQKYRDASKIEIRVLETLKRHDPNNDNKCIHLTEYFDFRNHPCLVSELYGMSVFDFLKQNSFSPFPEKHIQDFARSLLKSVAFLHQLKLVHTDLKPENILLCSNEARLQGPRVRGAKSKQILRNTEIRLIDFGSATFESEYHSSVVSTRHYRAPEIILGLPWSYPCDLFSIGCILVEFYTGDALFQTHDNLEHLAMMEVVMGKFSQRMLEKGRAKKPEFFRGTKIDFPNAQTSKSSRKYVKSMKNLKDIIAPTTRHGNLFLDLCVRLLEADPDVRIKIQDALRHPYLSEPIPDPA